MTDPLAPIEALADDLGGHATDFHRGTEFRLRAAIAEARAQMGEEWGAAHADDPDYTAPHSSEGSARNVVDNWNTIHSDGRAILRRRYVTDWEPVE